MCIMFKKSAGILKLYLDVKFEGVVKFIPLLRLFNIFVCCCFRYHYYRTLFAAVYTEICKSWLQVLLSVSVLLTFFSGYFWSVLVQEPLWIDKCASFNPTCSVKSTEEVCRDTQIHHHLFGQNIKYRTQ